MIGAAATVILAALTLTQVLSLALVLVPVLVLTHAETNVLKKMDHRENLFSASYWLLMVYGTCHFTYISCNVIQFTTYGNHPV